MTVSLGQRLAATGFVAASRTFSALPRSVTIPLARLAGRAAYLALRGRRRVALDNLEAALGDDVPAHDRRRIAIASFGHAASMAMDLLTLPRVARDPDAHCLVAPDDLDLLRRLKADGRGAILVAGHFGLFESMGIALGHAGFPVSFVAKPFDNALLDEAINARRRLTGNGYVPKGGARARIQRLLEEGGSVAIVIDQHVAPKDRLWIPFFGMPAPTARSVGTLALDTGAPLVPIHSFPLPGGRCRCEFGPIVDVRRTGQRDTDAEALVAAVVREMERAVRRRPEAWLWMHRRWKVRPTEERGRFPRYSISEAQERQRIEARRQASGGDVAAGTGVLATFPPAPSGREESFPRDSSEER